MEKEKEIEKAITITSKGKREVRVFVEKGSYVRYTYLDKEGKIIKKGKESIFLKSEEGKIEHFFIVPMKKGFLLLKSDTKDRFIYLPKEKKVKKISELF